MEFCVSELFNEQDAAKLQSALKALKLDRIRVSLSERRILAYSYSQMVTEQIVEALKDIGFSANCIHLGVQYRDPHYNLSQDACNLATRSSASGKEFVLLLYEPVSIIQAEKLNDKIVHQAESKRLQTSGIRSIKVDLQNKRRLRVHTDPGLNRSQLKTMLYRAANELRVKDIAEFYVQ